MMENGSEENIPYQLYQSSKELDGISTKDQSLLSETGRMNAIIIQQCKYKLLLKLDKAKS
jgi:hypothetical protein